MIPQGSRYEDSTVVNVTVNGSTRTVIVPSPQKPYTITYRSYVMTANDSPDTLAAHLYGDATLWWKIADANPEILEWFSIAPGTVIRVPAVT